MNSKKTTTKLLTELQPTMTLYIYRGWRSRALATRIAKITLLGLRSEAAHSFHASNDLFELTKLAPDERPVLLPLEKSSDRCGQLLERFAMLRVSPPRHGFPRRPCTRRIPELSFKDVRSTGTPSWFRDVCFDHACGLGFPLAGRVEELFVVAQPSVAPCSAMCVSSITP